MPKKKYELTEKSLKVKFRTQAQNETRVGDLEKMIKRGYARKSKLEVAIFSQQKELKLLKNISKELYPSEPEPKGIPDSGYEKKQIKVYEGHSEEEHSEEKQPKNKPRDNGIDRYEEAWIEGLQYTDLDKFERPWAQGCKNWRFEGLA